MLDLPKLFQKLAINLQTEVGFCHWRKVFLIFDFVLGGYGFNTINNFSHFYGYDFLGIAADSYIKSSVTLDYELSRKTISMYQQILQILKTIFFDFYKMDLAPKIYWLCIGIWFRNNYWSN